MSYAPAAYSSHDAPLSAREISDRALDYEYDTDVPLKYWLRTTGTLQREVRPSFLLALRLQLTRFRRRSTSEKEMTSRRISCFYDMQSMASNGMWLRTTLTRCSLLIERLPTHPSAREPENRKHLSILQKVDMHNT